MTQTLTLDVESTSECDLAKSGVAAYWQHPSTVLICVSWRIVNSTGIGAVFTWRPGDRIPTFATAGCLGTIDRVVAHNFLFEYWAWREHLTPKHGWNVPKLDQWDCTMARALYWGLPAALIDVARVLNLPHQIDPAKKSRIKRMARPRGHGISGLPYYWHDTDSDKLKELLADCENDVLTECDLDDALPPLPAREREIFLIDAEINIRGIMLDLPMVDALTNITDSEGARLNDEMTRLTAGAVTTCNQNARILRNLEVYGVELTDLTKATVAEALKTVRDDTARDILLVRQEAAKASTAKLKAMTLGASPDGRARGLFQYCGAGRTHRWAARRIQPQNVPRGVLKGLASVFNLIEKGHVQASVLATLLPCTVMDMVSSMLRGCLIASPAHMLVSADLSQIEARLTAWYAGQQDVLDVFASGQDAYVYAAAKIGSSDRNLGKVLVLACGFGMGPDKFMDTANAAPYNLKLTAQAAEASVKAWRKANAKIVQFWWDCDAAFRSVAQGGHLYEERVGHVIFRKTSKAVRIILPSGSELTYHYVELVNNPATGRDDITFMGVDPKTKQWSQQRTYGGKIVENIVQATDRDILAEAMIGLRGYPHLSLLGNMHDELLGEAPEQFAGDALRMVLAIMRQGVNWAPGLPVGAEGFVARRYKK